MIKQLAHVCIVTLDLAATERFYCDVLGLSKGFDFERAGRIFGFYLKAGENTFIEVFEGDPAGAATGIRHLCLETDDLDDVTQRLTSAGVSSTNKVCAGDHSWQIWCKDPNGIDIEFHQYTDKSMQLVGGVCKVG